MYRVRMETETIDSMVKRAAETGAHHTTLVAVADQWIAKWADLAAMVDAGADLDGRASIYTGETYAQARDRWTAYRDALSRSM